MSIQRSLTPDRTVKPGTVFTSVTNPANRTIVIATQPAPPPHPADWLMLWTLPVDGYGFFDKAEARAVHNQLAGTNARLLALPLNYEPDEGPEDLSHIVSDLDAMADALAMMEPEPELRSLYQQSEDAMRLLGALRSAGIPLANPEPPAPGAGDRKPFNLESMPGVEGPELARWVADLLATLPHHWTDVTRNIVDVEDGVCWEETAVCRDCGITRETRTLLVRR